ncbi:MAG: hypothetical protein QG597_3462 [Actinomycetota bacterium]|nr:hypothetical protein [Actinomycetota bacterium]
MARSSDSTAKSGKAGKAAKPAKTGRIAQIRQTYQIAKRSDPKLGWILIALFFGTLAIFVVAALLLPVGTITKVLIIVLGLSTALLVTSYIFGRRAEKAAYSQIAGQPGAAAAVLSSMRGAWFTTPAVAVNKNEDMVHMVIGRPGVILVGEGSPTRVTHLMRNQHKKLERWVPETPFHEVIIGEGEGEVPLTKIQRTLLKMPKVLRPAEVTDVRTKLEAATKANNPLPIPKGPMPKNARMPRPPKSQR